MATFSQPAKDPDMGQVLAALRSDLQVEFFSNEDSAKDDYYRREIEKKIGEAQSPEDQFAVYHYDEPQRGYHIVCRAYKRVEGAPPL